jgi:uncharacterized membrane protein
VKAPVGCGLSIVFHYNSEMAEMADTRSVKSTARVQSLDGLRGLAALIVVIHHSFLTGSSFAEPYMAPNSTPVTVGTELLRSFRTVGPLKLRDY